MSKLLVQPSATAAFAWVLHLQGQEFPKHTKSTDILTIPLSTIILLFNRLKIHKHHIMKYLRNNKHFPLRKYGSELNCKFF